MTEWWRHYAFLIAAELKPRLADLADAQLGFVLERIHREISKQRPMAEILVEFQETLNSTEDAGVLATTYMQLRNLLSALESRSWIIREGARGLRDTEKFGET